MLGKLLRFIKGSKSEEKMSKAELEGIKRFEKEIVKPGMDVYLMMIKELEKPGFIEFRNESAFSKCFRCLCMYDSAIKHIIKAKVKSYAEVKMHLEPPADLACEILNQKGIRDKFQSLSIQLGMLISQEPTRLELNFKNLFNPFKKFFGEFLKKAKLKDEAVSYFNDNVPKLMRTAQLALRDDWNKRSCKLRFENLPRFNDFWKGPDSIDESVLRERVIQITAADNELTVLLARMEAILDEFNKSLPFMVGDDTLNGLEGFQKLSKKLDGFGKK